MGKKRHTIEFIRSFFEEENYVFLTKEYVNNKQKLNYICPKGHKGSISWNGWNRGYRCRRCSQILNANKKKLTINFILKQFKKEGYQLLIKKYINNTQRLEYICPNGHTGSITWNSWKQGCRCQQCFREHNRGKNHSNWSLNLTEKDRQKNKNKRSYPEYNEWRKLVYERDNYTCQICLKRGGYLIAHHLESYNSNPKLRTALSNGVTLCNNCHNNFHHQYGNGNNTGKQLKEFAAILRAGHGKK